MQPVLHQSTLYYILAGLALLLNKVTCLDLSQSPIAITGVCLPSKLFSTIGNCICMRAHRHRVWQLCRLQLGVLGSAVLLGQARLATL